MLRRGRGDHGDSLAVSEYSSEQCLTAERGKEVVFKAVADIQQTTMRGDSDDISRPLIQWKTKVTGNSRWKSEGRLSSENPIQRKSRKYSVHILETGGHKATFRLALAKEAVTGMKHYVY